jgi:hypothetical protein
MATDEECVEYARECVRLAALATDQELRDQLLQMARNWMAEAMHERCKDAVALTPASPEPSRNRILTPSSAIDATTRNR